MPEGGGPRIVLAIGFLSNVRSLAALHVLACRGAFRWRERATQRGMRCTAAGDAVAKGVSWISSLNLVTSREAERHESQARKPPDDKTRCDAAAAD